jgi:drug/metabolite transporter (DMT)-like permease
VTSSASPSGPRSALLVDGTGLAFVGVLAFSVTLPMTRLAIEGFDPAVVGTGRSVGAGLIAAVALVIAGVPFPPRRLWGSFALIALGVGIGFGFLTSLALRTESAAHGAVVIALLPVATAVVATLRGGERPGKTFWAASVVGTVIVLGYVLARSGFDGLSGADALFLLATVCAAVGYAEGGRLAQEMPGWQVISWAMVFTLPLAIPATAWAIAVSEPAEPTARSLVGFGYLIVVSMFVGFVAWYRGMGLAGVARASQVQLLQPLLTVGWAALLLGEVVPLGTVLTAVAVVACIAVTQRARIGAVGGVS